MRSALVISLVIGAATVGATVLLWLLSGNSTMLQLPSIALMAVAFGRSEIVSRRSGDDRKLLQKYTGERLADEARRYWKAEERLRLQRMLSSMPLRWRRTATGRRPVEQLPEKGDVNELISIYCSKPFRVVLLGEAGSGKSALCFQLALALLENDSTARVPVLLQLSSWDRTTELATWVADQLRTIYRIPKSAGRALIESGKILPILDGLDEGPDQSVASALKRMRDSPMLDHPYVLTCREADFDEADSDHLVIRDAEIRIIPLTADEIAESLTWVASGGRRWQPVAAAVRDDPSGPLATALNTRLMLHLLTRVYATSDERPKDLLDTSAFPDASTIKGHLIDRFLATALATADVKQFRDPAKTDRWLEYIAAIFCDLGQQRTGSSDKRLSWWRFFRAVESGVFIGVRVIAGTTITGLLGLLLLGLFGHPVLGLLIGGAIGLSSGTLFGLFQPNEPRSLPMYLRSAQEHTRQVVLSAVAAALGTGLGVGLIYHNVVFAVGSALVCGLGFGTIRRRITAPLSDNLVVRSPLVTLRDDRAIVFTAWLLGGVVGGVIGGTLGSTGQGDRLGLIVTLHSHLAEAALGAGTGFVLGSFGLAVMVQANNAWGKLLITRPALALRGKTPLRLMSFLDAAQQAGILRSLGPQYDFSSDLYRQRLVDRAPVHGIAGLEAPALPSVQ
jgi:NACHT domain